MKLVSLSQYYRKTPVLESFFNKVEKNRLQHRCFSVNVAKFLRIPILKRHHLPKTSSDNNNNALPK